MKTTRQRASAQASFGFGAAALGLTLSAMGLSGCSSAGTVISGYLDAAGSVEGQTTSDTFPQGPHAHLMQVTSSGGHVMQTPTLQAISFNDDPQAELWASFVAALPQSAYWTATTGEYGVGRATAAPALRGQLTPGVTLTDGALSRGELSDIETYLTAQLDVADPPFGAPSASTLYILFTPPGAAVSPSDTASAQACAEGVLAWHTAMLLPRTKVLVAYVVVPDCGALGRLSAIDSRTLAASHAIIEAVTDPSLDGYASFDANHTAWNVVSGGGGISSACTAALYGDSNFALTPSDVGFMVQRTWSNAAAALGHNPCVPAPEPATAPYFDSIPVLPNPVTLPVGTSLLDPNVTTLGVLLPHDTTADVSLQLFSDGPTSGPWSVAAFEMGSQNMTLNLDKTQGSNGDTLRLHLAAGAQATGFSLVRVTSSLNSAQHSQYVLVAH